MVKLKNIREIVFSDDSLDSIPGLTCDYERVLDRAALLRVPGTFCQRKQRLADDPAT